MRILVLCALPVELEQVISRLVETKVVRGNAGASYTQGAYWVGAELKCEVLCVITGVGNEAAAIETERAIRYFDPKLCVFLGVAGGIKDVKIGDVVFGTKVYNYESGKYTDGFRPRPSVKDSSYELIAFAKQLSLDKSWRTICGLDEDFSLLFGPIASGEKVIANKKKGAIEDIRAFYGDSLALEMEGHGVLEAAWRNEGVKSLIVRGVSDLLGKKRQADESGSQLLAARNASRVVFGFLDAYYRNFSGGSLNP